MIQQIPLSKLVAHPRNPRRKMCEFTVEGLKVQIKERGSFDPAHALKVNPLSDGNFQIISGHQRVEAARRAGVIEVPCVVEEMDEATALLELLFSNNQTELSPLDIGTFLMTAIPMGKGGRGKSGGLAAIARKMNKSEQSLGDWVCAARVAAKLPDQSESLSDYLASLTIIHRCDESLWADLASRMLKGRWTKEVTERFIGLIKLWIVPDDLADILPHSLLIERLFSKGEFSATTLAAIVAAIHATEKMIRSSTDIDIGATLEEFHAWLRVNPMRALDQRQIRMQQRLIEQRLERAQVEAARSWNFGNWRRFIEDLPDNSVALVLMDPPYGKNFQSRRSKTGPRHRGLQNDQDHESAMHEVSEAMTALYPKLKADAFLVTFYDWLAEAELCALLDAAGFKVKPLVWVKDGHGAGDLSDFAPQHERLLSARKGGATLFRRLSDVLPCPRPTGGKHPTEKPVALLRRLIEAMTIEGETVVDPFGGIASTLVAAKLAGRKYWGCEIDEEYYREGARRLAEEALTATAVDTAA